MGATAAFFDLDGTLCTEHAWKALVRYHRARRQKRAIIFAYLAGHMALWPLHRMGALSKERFYRAWARDLAWLVAGLTAQEAQELFRWVVDEQIAPSFRPDVLEILRHHQSQGHLVVLVSGAFQDLLAIVGERLGVNHIVGTELEVARGRYTGRIVEPLCFGRDKARLLRSFLSDNHFQVDLEASFAYADSIFDVPVLELVGHPVAVYPDEELEAHALQRGWRIVGRKDETRR